jgi:methyltransferase
MIPAVLLLAFVTVSRLAELWFARRNTAALLAAGAAEFGDGHYPALVAMHATWLAGLWLAGWDSPVAPGWFGVFAVLQLFRAWVVATLGRRWTTRIIVMPGLPLERGGPYRFVPHPNYLVVAGEIAVLPLCFGLPWYAAAFSIANALILDIRIRAENAALEGSRAVARA